MKSSTLDKLVIRHHDQARHIAKKTMRCNPGIDALSELIKVGRRLTTRVERRLRETEMRARYGRRQSTSTCRVAVRSPQIQYLPRIDDEGNFARI